MSGVIDRMHVGPEGVCIYDYKTDMAEDADSLRTKYEGQMKAYREAMGSVMRVPLESVRVYLVSTHLKTLIEA
jgi:ATP-dependent exoDNAse (exonuclease V) beta subunit